MATSVAPRMPMFPPGAPGIGQQFLYGQAPPAMIPPQVSTSLYSNFCFIKFYFGWLYVDTLVYLKHFSS